MTKAKGNQEIGSIEVRLNIPITLGDILRGEGTKQEPFPMAEAPEESKDEEEEDPVLDLSFLDRKKKEAWLESEVKRLRRQAAELTREMITEREDIRRLISEIIEMTYQFADVSGSAIQHAKELSERIDREVKESREQARVLRFSKRG